MPEQPESLALRGYRMTVDNHTKEANRALGHVQDAARRLTVNDTSAALRTAKQLATDLADLTAHLAALKALTDVEFLATGLTEERPE